MRFTWRFALSAAVALTATCGIAVASELAVFRTPSGGIGCGYYANTLRCDVAGGVRPLPPRPKNCDLDWGGGFSLAQHGKATVMCAGDTALNPAAPVVRYGTTWARGSIACSSSPDGLRCTNADRHGFFLSRGEAYRF
jgi:Family of unknown function (DUF6636)